MENIKAKKKQHVYKTVFIPNQVDGQTEREEILIEVGEHAECKAALAIAEKEALGGKSSRYDLKKGHFALLICDERLLERKGELRKERSAALNAQAQAPAVPEGRPQPKAPKARQQAPKAEGTAEPARMDDEPETEGK